MKFKVTALRGSERKTLRCTIPDTFQEVTVDQWLQIEAMTDRKDIIALIKIFTGASFQDLFNASKPRAEGAIFRHMNKLIKSAPKSWKGLPIPKTVTISGKEITIPTKLEEEKWGKSLMMRNVLENADLPLRDRITQTLAIFLQEYYDGEFNTNNVQLVADLVRQEPALQFIPIANFFLSKYKLSFLYGTTGSNLFQMETLTQSSSEPMQGATA